MTVDPSEVHAVVVAFNPGPSLERLCGTLVAAGCPVLVVDNASESGHDVLAACRDACAEVLRLPETAGVSGALAVGYSHSLGYKWLLTFDQDSIIEAEFIQALLSSPAIREPQVAMIGPRVVDASKGNLLQGSERRNGPETVPLIITSGALCRVSALDNVGGFREDLFIDHVDHDICLRLRSQGWTITVEPSATMRHSVGQMRTHRVAGIGIRNSHHSADRQYYKYRNFILLLRDGTARTDLRWSLRTLLALSWGPLKILTFETDKAAKLKAICAGVCDGVCVRAGRRPDPAPRRTS